MRYSKYTYRPFESITEDEIREMVEKVLLGFTDIIVEKEHGKFAVTGTSSWESYRDDGEKETIQATDTLYFGSGCADYSFYDGGEINRLYRQWLFAKGVCSIAKDNPWLEKDAPQKSDKSQINYPCRKRLSVSPEEILEFVRDLYPDQEHLVANWRRTEICVSGFTDASYTKSTGDPYDVSSTDAIFFYPDEAITDIPDRDFIDQEFKKWLFSKGVCPYAENNRWLKPQPNPEVSA